MTPVQINMILSIGCGPEIPYLTTGAGIAAMAMFHDEGLVATIYSDIAPRYELTERGRAYFEALKLLPLPTKRVVTHWDFPLVDKTVDYSAPPSIPPLLVGHGQ